MNSAAKESLRQEFYDREARQDYAEFFLHSAIALQIKALRLQRGWSQEQLGQEAGMAQSRICEMEKAAYGAWSVTSLSRLAKAFDVALMVRFESFGRFFEEGIEVSRDGLERPSFDDDPAFQPAEDATEQAAPAAEDEPQSDAYLRIPVSFRRAAMPDTKPVFLEASYG